MPEREITISSDQRSSAFIGGPASIGFVAIGRNEGERLRACLTAAAAQRLVIVYVDSNSTDGSVALARSLGAEVVELDLSKPFTAARARNEGAARLLQTHPDVAFIQFVDGDCELNAGWISAALAKMHEGDRIAVVCGRRRERFPDATVYNAICDMEWDTPIGLAKSCGGDALVRREAFTQVGGYNPSIIAGEEPEMCVRLRQRGWQIWRIDAEMTLHDAAMTRLGQWWKRHLRAGHAFAEGYHRHGAPPECMWKKNVVSNYVWGLPPMWALWPLLWLKIYRSRPSKLYATFTTFSKLPQALGQLKFHWNRLTGARQGIIEYK
jgi:GT2 family glycosyltransferase